MKNRTMVDLVLQGLLLASVLGLLTIAFGCKRGSFTPPIGPDPSPTPPPPIFTGGPLEIHPSNPHYLLNAGEPYLIVAYGNVVTAIPGHDWHLDVAEIRANGGNYARFWHILAGTTQEWPWLRVGERGRWDFNQWNPVYFEQLHAVYSATQAAGIILEIHLFDRGGGGGNNSDWKASPWYPSNNVNGLETSYVGDGNPEFYELKNKPNLRKAQAAYIRKMTEELGPYTNAIIEVENEGRTPEIGWAEEVATLIHSIDPTRLVSYSTIFEEAWQPILRSRAFNIANLHAGRSVERDPAEFGIAIAPNWKHNKPINVDEFANGTRSPDLLRAMCWTIITSGGHFHLEDVNASADPWRVVKNIHRFLRESGWDFASSKPVFENGLCMDNAHQMVCYGSGPPPGSDWNVRWWDPINGGFIPSPGREWVMFAERP